MNEQTERASRGTAERPGATGRPAKGRLYGVGLGPGDPSLMTVRAVELIGSADVVAYHSARHGRSIARSIAERYLRPDQVEEKLVYPVTTETTDHPGGYRGAMDEFYEEAAARLAAHLDAGRDVAVLAEGDPFFYGSYMHMHKRLAHRYPTEVVPGVTSVSAAAARIGRPLVEGEEVLTVLPGTLPEEELAARLASSDAAAVLKLGRTFPAVRRALERSGRLSQAHYVERATMAGERTAPLAEVDPESVPYFSVAVLPSRIGAPEQGPRAAEAGAARVDTAAAAAAGASVRTVATTVCDGRPDRGRQGRVVVVGLGPAGPMWLTPEARGALADAEDLVGYTTYLDRVPVRPGQRRHASDNKVESERAEFALDLARAGRRVAVVSSGDPGVFAMATAVLEVASSDPYRDVPVEVLPGVTAANAAASRVGAPLGHDYAVVSLSDRLKPWEVIAERLRAAAAADLVLALYNPGSRSRVWQVGKARELLLEHRAPDTPVVLARDVGGPTERVRIVRLADLDPEQVDMRTILLVGSSQTRVVERGDGTEAVWTPRRHPGG
ncbi:precorrin-3B C(17)-methyltransferase [Wenjunlia tyrosinilytica]|uniref:Precorrin-3B C(17)-methyltransferase n=1 Tax=Wenjunlia tyrosinilytica TaxID=1544741 RepID=A0A917ZSB3_9ACTN|nr:precorrin-2 C(20)-methyltransferase [Wenjunlia tyrosinilytica]GGO90806.1 precorrin-3B C(17)-methyltransferase [Wenjunlia tyrosinilytica]